MKFNVGKKEHCKSKIIWLASGSGVNFLANYHLNDNTLKSMRFLTLWDYFWSFTVAVKYKHFCCWSNVKNV